MQNATGAEWREVLQDGRRRLSEGKLPGQQLVSLAAILEEGDPNSGIGLPPGSERDVLEMLVHTGEVIKFTDMAGVVGATSGPSEEARLVLKAALTIQLQVLRDPNYQCLVMNRSAHNQELGLLDQMDSMGNTKGVSGTIMKPPRDQQDLVARLHSIISPEGIISIVKENNDHSKDARLGGGVGSRGGGKPPIREGAGGWCVGTRDETRELWTGRYEELLVEKMAHDCDRIQGQIYTARDVQVLENMWRAQIDILCVKGNPEGVPLPHPVQIWRLYMIEEAELHGCDPEDVDILHELFDLLAKYEAQDREQGAPTCLL